MIFGRKKTREGSISPSVLGLELVRPELNNLNVTRYGELLTDYRAEIPEAYRKVFDNLAPNTESALIASTIIGQDSGLCLEEYEALQTVLIEQWIQKSGQQEANA